MTNLEIREKINLNNKLIRDMFTPNQFVLNNMVATLLRENKKLQKQCRHEFVDGYCIYCDIEEKQ